MLKDAYVTYRTATYEVSSLTCYNQINLFFNYLLLMPKLQRIVCKSSQEKMSRHAYVNAYVICECLCS